MSLNEDEILNSWEHNASEWTAAVAENRIASRRTVTNAAILEAIGPGLGLTALDLGCGEGWLSRALSKTRWRVVGVDGSEALIRNALTAGREEYFCLDYSRLESELPEKEFDLVVCNFSLLGDSSTREAVRAASAVLKPGGRLIIQTIHPMSLDGPYRSGWKTEDWAGFTNLDCRPSPWYFHTLSDWIALLREAGFNIVEIREPATEGADSPSSLILISAKPSQGRLSPL